MDDLISRRAAIRWIKTECNPYGKPSLDFESGKKIIKHLKQMPSTQLEIIRCKDCIYSDTFPKDADNDMPLKGLGIRYGGVMPDWYCEHAEKREDD